MGDSGNAKDGPGMRWPLLEEKDLELVAPKWRRRILFIQVAAWFSLVVWMIYVTVSR